MIYDVIAGLLMLGAGLAWASGRYVPPRTNLDAARLDDLIHWVSTHYQFGETDEGLTVDQWTAKASRGERVTLTCGYVAEWARVLLTNAGYKARTVDWYTLEKDEYEGVDIGHTNLEVWHPRYGQWVVVDFSLQRLYPQTAVSFQQQRVHPIVMDAVGAVAHEAFPSEEAWLAYITGVLIIHDEHDNRYYFEARRKDTLKAWDARPVLIVYDEFLRKFYQ